MEENEIFNQLWVEKYRPKTLEDVVLTEDQKTSFEKYIQQQNIPQMLLAGPPGSGKTTTARIFIKYIVKNHMDVLSLNGSDTNGIDFFRDNVIEFCKTPPISSRIKIVFVDEADGITIATQQLLRNALETYSANVRFIFTCNFLHKIIAPLQSRCTLFEMKEMPPEFVKELAYKILTKENVKFDKPDVDLIVTSLMPDVRKVINTIQKNSNNGQLKRVKAEDLVTIENKIIGLIVELCDSVGKNTMSSTTNKVLPTILDILKKERNIELGKVYDVLFNHDGLPAWAKVKVNEYANRHTACFSQPYNFMALCYDLVQTGLSFVKTFGIK